MINTLVQEQQMERTTGLFISNDSLSAYVYKTIAKDCRVLCFSFEEIPFVKSQVFEFGDICGIASMLKKENVKQVAIIGRISPSKLFSQDIHCSGKFLLEKETQWQNENLMLKTTCWFEQQGIRLLPLTDLLKEIIAVKKVYTKKKTDKQQKKDITTGISLLKSLIPFRTGQAAVVKKAMVIAVEGIEGTDAMIKRAGEYCKDFIVVKMAGSNKDERFDLPTVGPTTIETMSEAGGKVLAIEAGKTILFEKEKTVALCEKNNIVLIGIKG